MVTNTVTATAINSNNSSNNNSDDNNDDDSSDDNNIDNDSSTCDIDDYETCVFGDLAFKLK